jgi:hypothetical protein
MLEGGSEGCAAQTLTAAFRYCVNPKASQKASNHAI